MRSTPTNVQLTLTLLTSTSKHGYSYFATMANPQACQTNKVPLFPKMCIRSSIRLPASVRLLALNGEYQGLARCHKPLALRLVVLPMIGAGGWLKSSSRNRSLSRQIHTTSAKPLERRYHRDNLAHGKNK